MVSPVDQAYDPAEEDVKVTEPPRQKVVGPLAVMVGVDGTGFTVTDTALLVALQPDDAVTVTVYDPEAETIIDCVVAPVDHT